ncbi:GNAT family N-acetyltransferase [Oleispirillum naphthae]|uniref:GNAT family N-acetyltransferase n=1 Tax=Oleispirillum naphthae TaxID=2838853 RepID=UPI0030824B37
MPASARDDRLVVVTAGEADRLRAFENDGLLPANRRWLAACLRAYGLSAALWRQDGAVTPFLKVGRAWVCLPFTHYAEVDAAGASAAADGLRRCRPDAPVELRTAEPPPDAAAEAEYDRFVLDCSADAWANLSSRHRGKIRKAERDGLRFSVGPSELDDFYRLYARAMRDLGTPPHARRFFAELAEALGEGMTVATVRAGGTVVAAAAATVRAGEMVNEWAAQAAAHDAPYPMDFLYWRLYELAGERGLHGLDLGRALRGGSLHRYKNTWHARVSPLYYRRVGFSGTSRESREGQGARMVSAIWKRLPVSLSNRLGGLVRRSIA